MRLPERLPRLMFVTDRHRTRRSPVDVARLAVEGGASFVQIREKDLDDDALREMVGGIRARVPDSTVLAVNGHGKVARSEGVGLHLPAGHHLGDREGIAPYGRSAHSADEVRAALDENVDYVIVGTIFETSSKPGLGGAGVGFLREMCDLASPTPVYAIGGVHVSNVPDAIHAGSWGVAVTGAISTASDPIRVAQALALAIGIAAGASG